MQLQLEDEFDSEIMMVIGVRVRIEVGILTGRGSGFTDFK